MQVFYVSSVMLAVLLSYSAKAPCVQAETGITPFMTLYTEQNHKGSNFTTNNAQLDLSIQNFDDIAKSICGIGFWFLYANDEYDEDSSFVHTFANHDVKCENLDITSWNEVSSLRYAGIEDPDFETLTLYENINLCGGEFLVMRDIDYIIAFNNRPMSFAATGNSSWTLYSQTGYRGETICITPEEINGWFYGIWDYRFMDLTDDTVSSVRKGCHAEKVYKYVPKHRDGRIIFNF